MTETMTAQMPCANGCVKPDGQTPFGATHGRYCSRCWGRLDTPLSQAGELVGHLIGNAVRSGGASDDRVDSTRDAPLPFNQAAFDDANELYSLLVYWCVVWSEHMRTPAPTQAQGAWRNDRGTIVGLPLDVTTEASTVIVTALAGWIRHRLDTILNLDTPDDIEAFTDAIGDVWRMNARWPRIERPAYSRMPCPRQDCGAKIAVYPPAFPGDTRRIVCTLGHWYPEEEYEHLREVFIQVQRERAAENLRTSKSAAELMRLYNIGRNTPAKGA